MMTGLISLAVILLFLLPDAAAFELVLAGPGLGEPWRWFSGHLLHWNGQHLFWDLLMFAVPGLMLERRSRGAFVLLVAGSALLITAVLVVVQPELGRYRGLSGIDSALFVALVLGHSRDAALAGRRGFRLAAVALLAVFLLKLGYESATGRGLFASDLGPGVSAVPLAHLCGAVAGVVYHRRTRRLSDATGRFGFGLRARCR